jgi:hypothetical protein
MPTKKKNKVNPLLVPGNIVLIRTAVYHALGRVVGTYAAQGVAFVQLAEASYVGDTGRYHEATSKPLRDVAQAEIEPVGSGGLLDVQLAIICDVARAVAISRDVK